jgi:ribosomal protein S18 acetylase RimI-like enzyme
LTDANEPVSTCAAIKALMKPDKDALGFVPVGGSVGITDAMIRGRVALALVDGIIRGYCLFSESDEGVKIQQCCVHDVYRGMGMGLARRMLGLIGESRGGPRMQARVRQDLPACGFWEACGFVKEAIDTHATSAMEIVVYRREPSQWRTAPLKSEA